MNCPNCGHEFTQTQARFCPKCGTSLGLAATYAPPQAPPQAPPIPPPDYNYAPPPVHYAAPGALRCPFCGSHNVLKGGIPTWAIITAIVGFFFVCVLSLFFLMIKDPHRCLTCGQTFN